MIARESANGVNRVVGRGYGTPKKKISRWLAAYVFLGTTAVAFGSSAAGPDADTADQDQKVPRKSAALKAMRERAEAPRVSSVNEPARTIKLIADPLLLYTDPQINILNSSLWALGDGGRPRALLKLEAHKWNGDVPPRVTWVTCFASISEDNLSATWPNGLRYKTSEPGLNLGTFADAPKPAATKPARLTQMRDLARRFSVEGYRLLPTPVYRYTDAQEGVRDGALFAWVATGTNPGVVLTVELSHRPDAGDSDAGDDDTADAEAKWQYSLVRLGTGHVLAKLEGRTVYEQPFTGNHPRQEATWMFFGEKGTLPQEEKEE